MKKIIVMMCMLVLCMSCTANKPEKEQGIIKIDTIPFSFEYVEDLIYSPEDGIFFIEYNNQDQFDYQNLADMTGRSEWYGFFVVCNINEVEVPVFVSDWDRYDAAEIYIDSVEIDEEWDILEIWTEKDGKKEVRFELICQR